MSGRPLLHHELRDRLQLHVGGTFIDRADLGIAIELLDGILLREAVAAVQIDARR